MSSISEQTRKLRLGVDSSWFVPFSRVHLWGLLSSFPVCPVAKRVRGSEEKPQVRRGGATGASAGANHTSARQSREERDGTPFAMLAAIGDLVHLLGLVSHPPPRSFHLFAAPAPTMESINASVWRHLSSSRPATCLGEPDTMMMSLRLTKIPDEVENRRWLIPLNHWLPSLRGESAF